MPNTKQALSDYAALATLDFLKNGGIIKVVPQGKRGVK